MFHSRSASFLVLHLKGPETVGQSCYLRPLFPAILVLPAVVARYGREAPGEAKIQPEDHVTLRRKRCSSLHINRNTDA